MERTVPSTASEEVDLYLRTYYSLLRSTAEIKIRSLEEVHIGMHSLLHPGGRLPTPDMPAFLYSLMRLPDCSDQVRLVVLGQSEAVFRRLGADVTRKLYPGMGHTVIGDEIENVQRVMDSVLERRPHA